MSSKTIIVGLQFGDYVCVITTKQSPEQKGQVMSSMLTGTFLQFHAKLI